MASFRNEHPCIVLTNALRRGVTHYRLFFLLHFYNNTAILKAMKRRATGLTMQLISPKSSFPLQDGKQSRQIEQMPQNNRLVASTNKLSVSLLKRCGVDARSLVEIKRRHAQKRTSVSIFGLQVCKQSSYVFCQAEKRNFLVFLCLTAPAPVNPCLHPCLIPLVRRGQAALYIPLLYSSL